MLQIKWCFTCSKSIPVVKYQGRFFCRKCYDALCYFCSERDGVPVNKNYCTGHDILSSTRNRFMEDVAFVKGGRFDLESE